jgi:hypothetical protein
VTEQTAVSSPVIRVAVDSGICGFHCLVEAWEKERRKVLIRITGSECQQIQRLAECVQDLSLKELFAPVSKNRIFSSAQACGCHPSCPVPVAVLKAVEVAMGMALPKDVVIRFQRDEKVD